MTIILKTLIIVFLSLFITDILINLGLFEKIKFIGKYFTKITKLPEFYSVTFVTSFGSSIAANTMLVSLQNEGKIKKKEIFIGALFNSISVYIKETFQYQIPIMIPILGSVVGIIYFSTFLLTGFFKFLLVVILGRKNRILDEINHIPTIKLQKVNLKDAIKNSFFNTSKIFLRIATIFIIISYLTFLLIKTGYISELSKNIIPILKFFKLPDVVLIPTSTFILSPLVGVSSLGALIKNRTITEAQGAIAALLGSFLFLPVFAIRSTLPNYAGVFGIKLGILILTFSTLLGMLTRILVIFLILVLWR